MVEDGSRKFAANTAYRHTLEAYIREFGTKPPATVWPSAIAPRLPRWPGMHLAVLGISGVMAWQNAEPLILAAGVGASLLIYGFDLYSAHLGRTRRGFGADLSDDLSYFLDETKGR